MKINLKGFFFGTLAFLMLAATHAAAPLWIFTPLTPTKIYLPIDGSVSVKYLVTNQSKTTHTLIMNSIKGVNQITTAGNCSSAFTLSYKQSCILNLEITGSDLEGNVSSGPVVCEQGNPLQCYQPSQAHSLHITKISNGDEFYVLDYDSNTVKVLDPRTDTVTQSITVDARPRDIVFNSARTRAYVANQAANTISVIDTFSYTVISTINGVTNPRKIVITPDDSTIYVQQDSITDNIQVVNLTTESVSSIDMSLYGGSVDIAINPNENILYSLTSVGEGEISGNNLLVLINTLNNTITNTLTLQGSGGEFIQSLTPTRISCTPNGAMLVIYSGGGGTTSGNPTYFFVTLNNNTVTYSEILGFNGLEALTSEASIAITPDSAKVFSNLTDVSTWLGGVQGCAVASMLFDFNLNSYLGSNAICTGSYPIPVTLNSIQGKIYYSGSDFMFVASSSTGDIISTLSIPSFSTGLNDMVFTQDGLKGYITNRGENVIYVWDPVNDVISSTISTNVGTGPSKMALKRPSCPGLKNNVCLNLKSSL